MIISVKGQNSDGATIDVVDHDGTIYSAIIPQELLNDEAGDGLSDIQYLNWINKNSKNISVAAKTLFEGGFVRRPFNKIKILGK